MRVTNGSAVSTASTPPDLMMSAMVGKVTSTKLTLLGSTPFSTSHFTNSTCRKAFKPGAPTFLPTKSFGSLMVMPLRTKAVMLPFDTGFITVAPAMATRSSPPSAAWRNTVEVGPPIWIEFERIAAGMFELMPIGVISTSSPCFLKMPSSIATMAEAQSDVAVQPTWILACAKALPVSARLTARAARTSFTTFSPLHIFLACLSIFFLIIYFRRKQGVPSSETRDIQIRRTGKDRTGAWGGYASVRCGGGRWPRRQRQSCLRIDAGVDRRRRCRARTGGEAVRHAWQGREPFGA